jgi:hypothetical protein
MGSVHPCTKGGKHENSIKGCRFCNSIYLLALCFINSNDYVEYSSCWYAVRVWMDGEFDTNRRQPMSQDNCEERRDYALEHIERELDIMKRFKPRKGESAIRAVDRMDSYEKARKAIKAWNTRKESKDG